MPIASGVPLTKVICIDPCKHVRHLQMNYILQPDKVDVAVQSSPIRTITKSKRTKEVKLDAAQ